MKTKVCNCDRWCKFGRKNKFFQKEILSKKSSARRTQKIYLSQERYDELPQVVLMGHTD